MSQTAYTIDQPEAFAGMKGDSEFDKVESKAAEGVVGFGLGLEAGTDPVDQVKVPSDAAGVFRGISIHQHVEPLSDGSVQYLDTQTVGVLRQGKVWMQQESSDIDTLAVDNAVFVNVAIAGVQLGRVTSVSTSNLSIPTGVCRKITVDPDGISIALIEINLP